MCRGKRNTNNHNHHICLKRSICDKHKVISLRDYWQYLEGYSNGDSPIPSLEAIYCSWLVVSRPYSVKHLSLTNSDSEVTGIIRYESG